MVDKVIDFEEARAKRAEEEGEAALARGDVFAFLEVPEEVDVDQWVGHIEHATHPIVLQSDGLRGLCLTRLQAKSIAVALMFAVEKSK